MDKDVSTPCEEYDNMAPLWHKCSVICSGEDAVKANDEFVASVSNFLIPFSASMEQPQYAFLRREAELPGVCAEFAAMVVGALIRKEPDITFPEDLPEGAADWIRQEFGSDGSPLITYLDAALWEEVTTSRGWTFVDYRGDVPVPIFFPATAIINWKYTRKELTQVIVAAMEEKGGTEFHPEYEKVVYVHELVKGVYQVRKFTKEEKDGEWVAELQPRIPLRKDATLDFIPAWPQNGELEPPRPFLLNLVNKEIALYNKIARRNHLLYGAATYTPYISSDMDDVEFGKVVKAGLGSWLNLPTDAKLDVMKTPTEALVDLDRSITNAFEEMARLGIRMLSPETTQSGVALNLRNANQTVRIGQLNTRVSLIMSQIIVAMLNWRYDLQLKPADIKFSLQNDAVSYAVGEGWMRLATEWYENSLIPRAVWLQMMRANEALPDDYDDEEGQAAIQKEQDEFSSYSDKLRKELDV